MDTLPWKVIAAVSVTVVIVLAACVVMVRREYRRRREDQKFVDAILRMGKRDE